MAGVVYLIGTGPGDPDLLTLRAARLIRSVDVVVTDRLVSPEILALVPATTRRIDVGKKAGLHVVPQDRINALLVDLAGAGLAVARLKGGDPLIFGRGSEEAAELAAAGIAYAYVPGITAAQGAACSTGIGLTHRDLATGVRYVTGHRKGDGPLDLDWASLADPDTTLVIYMGGGNIGEIAARLIAHGLSPHSGVLAVASVTTPRERRVTATLASIADTLAQAPMEAPLLFVIGRVVALMAEGARPLPLATLAAPAPVAALRLVQAG